MMQVAFQNNPKEFLDKCGAFLQQNEAEHNLILAICQGTEKKIQAGEKSETRFCTLHDNNDFVMAAVQMSKHNLVLSKSAQPDIEKMAEALAQHHFSFPGIVGPSDVASAFTDAWTQRTSQESIEYMDQIIYALKKVIAPRATAGEFRFATAEELPLLRDWIAAFSKDALPKAEHLTPETAQKKVAEMIKTQRAAVWTVNGKPVATASASGTSTVTRINGVYTPPEQRGHGYASALVAHLSQQQLDQGKKM